MILKIIGYWLILLLISYANMRVMFQFETTLNYKTFKNMSHSGIIFNFILYFGVGFIFAYTFITFTEWWFDFNLPLY